MSKTYKGWEILKMTEEGKLKEGDRISTNKSFCHIFEDGVWFEESGIEAGISDFIKERFMKLPRLVSFTEALNSNKKCWVEHPNISLIECLDCDDYTKRCFENLIEKQSQSIKNVLHVLSYQCSDNSLFMEIINNGRWYIKD